MSSRSFELSMAFDQRLEDDLRRFFKDRSLEIKELVLRSAELRKDGPLGAPTTLFEIHLLAEPRIVG
jgi:hypothetical protein